MNEFDSLFQCHVNIIFNCNTQCSRSVDKNRESELLKTLITLIATNKINML